MGQRLKDFLMLHPVGKEFMADAQWTDGDLHWRKNLPYFSTTFAGDGFALVGDVLRDFWIRITARGWTGFRFRRPARRNSVLAQQRGEPLESKLNRHNKDYAQSYERWFKAIYQNKYEYYGVYELVRLALLMYLGFYYLGTGSEPAVFARQGGFDGADLQHAAIDSVSYYFMRTYYNRRFASIARTRKARGCAGRTNTGRRFMFKGYTFTPGSAMPIVKAIAAWGMLELKEGWRSWFRKQPEPGMEISTVPGKVAMKTTP